jgi:hypothetical protein
MVGNSWYRRQRGILSLQNIGQSHARCGKGLSGPDYLIENVRPGLVNVKRPKERVAGSICNIGFGQLRNSGPGNKCLLHN